VGSSSGVLQQQPLQDAADHRRYGRSQAASERPRAPAAGTTIMFILAGPAHCRRIGVSGLAMDRRQHSRYYDRELAIYDDSFSDLC